MLATQYDPSMYNQLSLIHGNLALNSDITNRSRCAVHPAMILSTTSDSIIKHVWRGKAVNEQDGPCNVESQGVEGWEKRRQDYREAFDAESGYGNPSVPSGESSSHTTSIMNERYLVQWKTELNWHTDLLPRTLCKNCISVFAMLH